MTLQMIEKEEQRNAEYNKKISDFSKKYDKKSEWF